MGLDSQIAGLARALAPEDIRRGMHVTALDEVMEFPMRSCEIGAPETARLVRLVFMATDERFPTRVVDVCLPFVMVEKHSGEREMLDVRRVRLARVPAAFARAAKIRKKRPKKKGRKAKRSKAET